ncbi:MAG TPA: glycosyltransferase [Acidobacteriota bacterium]|nr:glycosyltransferase [Acidobacteriota bacterium]
MENNFSILFVLNSMYWGGIGRIISDVSCRLPESIRQTFVLLQDKAVYPYRGRLFVLQKSSGRHRPVRIPNLLQNGLRLRRILKEVKPDIVVALHHDSRTVHLLAKASLPAMRYKTVMADLGMAAHYSKYLGGARKQVYGWLVSLALRQADRIIAIAEGVKADLVAGFGVDQRKIDVIYGSVDPEQVRQMAAESVEHPWFSEDIPIIVLSGRLVFEKNQADLLRACADVRKSIACRLVLVGDGVEKGNLIRLARDLGIAEDVLFTGFQANPHKFVARSSVFAFPSVFEAQGLVMVEAMAVGCPVVAYDCPVGPREMLAPGTTASSEMRDIEEARYGILVPSGNVQALGKAILKLLGDPQLRERYSRIARERATQFNAQDMAEKYLNTIRTVLDM